MKKKYQELISLGGVYSLGSFMEKGLAIIFIPLYTTFLTTKDYGIIGLMSATINIIHPFINTPVIAGFIRHYYAPYYKNKRKEILFNGILYALIQSFFIASLFYLANSFLAKIILNDPSLNYIVKIYALILIFNTIKSFVLPLIRVQKKAKLYIIINIIRMIFTYLLIIYLLVIQKMGVMALVYGELFKSSYYTIILLPYIFKNIKIKIDFNLLKPLLSYGYPLVLSSVSMQLIQVGDRYILQIYDTLDTVGLYSFGYSFGSIINFFLVLPMKHAINPLIFEMEKNPNELKKFTSKICTYYLIISLLFCLLLSIFAKDIIQLLARKKQFWEAWVIVPIIAFSYVQHGLRDLFGKGILMGKKTVYSGGSYIVAASINLGLNFILIPYFGIIGAAFATLISYICLDVMSAYYSYKIYGLNFEINKLLLITIISIIIYSLSIPLNNYTFYIRILLKTCLVILFILIIYFFIFSLSEKKYIKEIIKDINSTGIIPMTRNLIRKKDN